ncbi:MAG: mechanosensitive ion channel family protein, partial [Azovibrio sp.]
IPVKKNVITLMVEEIDRTMNTLGIIPEWQGPIKLLLGGVLTALIFYGLRWFLARILSRLFNRAYRLSQISFFNYLIRNRLPQYLGAIIPLGILKTPMLLLVESEPYLHAPLVVTFNILLIVLIMGALIHTIQSGMDVLKERPWFQSRPVDSYMQVVKIIAFVIGSALIFSNITGSSPTTFFAAMGAASAVLLLMFRDTIMGFVASIQVTTNDMVRLGDWITMSKYGADGNVIQITLTTVKVQNFDKTITTIPTYALISDSFQNWRGMQHSGGRRIKRAIMIKQSSIRYIRDDEITHFKQIQGISTYVEERSAEIAAYNHQIQADRTISINGRNMTNAGLFRRYALWYISTSPAIRDDMTLMVRQLAPTSTGLPFEIYAFTNTIVWKEYEDIMADIFDHLIAAVPFFDMQIFEERSGRDVLTIRMENQDSTTALPL